MKHVSLFSGIEAATVAWEPLGWEPVRFAEFDEFPGAVSAERYPEVPNVGDVTEMSRKRYRGKVDPAVGGSPCQSPTLTADWHNPAVYPMDGPITTADLNANTAIGYDTAGTLEVGGDAPSVCL